MWLRLPPVLCAFCGPRPHIGAVQHLDLTDDEAVALTRELHDIVENDRYPFSPRIRTLRGIVAKLRPEPVREGLSFAQASIPEGSTQPLPPPKVYAPREQPRPDGPFRPLALP
jgi:hypothetical protein